LYNDQQKLIAFGPDGFPRFVYFDNDWTEIHFVRCLDHDCTAIRDIVIASNQIGIDAPSIVVGSDGFARITYLTYTDPREIHFVRCKDADCMERGDEIIDTSPASGYPYYNIAFALDAHDIASIVYNNSATKRISVANCLDLDCTSTTIDSTQAFLYGSTLAIAIAGDGFARFAYFDTSPNRIIYATCGSTDCSVLSTTTIPVTNTPFYVDMVLDSEYLGRIVTGYGGKGSAYVQCTNNDCSTYTTTNLDSENENIPSILMGQDGFPRITYGLWRTSSPYNYSFSARGQRYVRCLNDSCSERDTTTFARVGGYPSSIALGQDGFPRILYTGSDGRAIILSRFLSDDVNRAQGTSLGTPEQAFASIATKGLQVLDPYLTATFAGDVSVGGNVTIGGSLSANEYVLNEDFAYLGKVYRLRKTVPIVNNNAVAILSSRVSNGGHNFNVSITVSSSGFSVAKYYAIPVSYSEAPSWQEVLPLSDTGPYGGNDFALDIKSSGNDLDLRLRRTSGTASGVADIVIEHLGLNSETPVFSSSTEESVIAPTTHYSATALSQVNGRVGIGTTTPSQKLTVVGNVYASSFIDDGITLNAPDYVFDDPAYYHFTLEEIESFTDENYHLPWLTPRNSGPMALSTRINEILEALENLFLHVFELAKRVVSVEDKNLEQDAEIEALKAQDARISELEARLAELLGEELAPEPEAPPTETLNSETPPTEDSDELVIDPVNGSTEDTIEPPETSNETSAEVAEEENEDENPEPPPATEPAEEPPAEPAETPAS
jgi:hypothetical protein